MINDCSPLSDWNIVETEAKMDKRIKGINFSRNFGQHCAITAGLEFSSGEYIVVMDGDLQDQPEEILNLYNKILVSIANILPLYLDISLYVTHSGQIFLINVFRPLMPINIIYYYSLNIFSQLLNNHFFS